MEVQITEPHLHVCWTSSLRERVITFIYMSDQNTKASQSVSDWNIKSTLSDSNLMTVDCDFRG